MTTTPTAAANVRVHRIEVWAQPGQPDPLGEATLAAARASFPAAAAVRSARVYLVQAPLDDEAVRRLAVELLADPVAQRAQLQSAPTPEATATVEAHYKPGVMDPVAQSTREAIGEMLPHLPLDQVAVQTGHRFDITFEDGQLPDAAQLTLFGEKQLGNPVIQQIHAGRFHPERFPTGSRYTLQLTRVAIRELDDAGLEKMSREAHLFLSLEEMRAIRDYYRDAGREPTDIELETLAQTWSEHCVHKTLKSTVRYREERHEGTEARRHEGGQSEASRLVPEPDGAGAQPASFTRKIAGRPGHEIHDDGSITIHNLLKSTVAAATFELMEQPTFKDWCVSVFVDNAGIVKFDDDDAVCIKVETHNHPSAIEPYGGAATGIGGCIRDVLGTGLAAQPIANTDVFAVAHPDTTDLPRGVIHPRRTLERVMAGVRDYGNRMGIPTVNGAVLFDQGYLANPLVFAGCVGLIPLDRCFGDPQPGDHIIALGGRTGRDGIHGATFSSAELTDTHADEFSHAVQIGNAITQKKMADVILQARDAQGGPLFSAITDCGAGGFSSAVGEMGEKVGARVTLETAPLKYQGLSYTEVWISEAQERMVLSVPEDKLEALGKLCQAEDVEMCDLGRFGETDEAGAAQLVLTWEDQEVGRLSMHLLHEGLPMPTREATWTGKIEPAIKAPRERAATVSERDGQVDLADALHKLLAHPNIASKHWIVRQYDHEVQGGSAVKPLVGPGQDGPSDGSVVRPKLGSDRAVAIASGLAPFLADPTLASDADPYWSVLAAIDEAIRNSVCVGAAPDRIAILDNFCWPGCNTPEAMGTLVRAAEACYDGALAYRAPFVSGKDSLNNQFTTESGQRIAIPPTLLVTALGIVDDVSRCRTMDAKAAGSALLIVGHTTPHLGGSHYRMLGAQNGDTRIPRVDLTQGPANARAVAQLIEQHLAASAHDCSEGGLLVAAAEMAFAGRVGLEIDLETLPADTELDDVAACFAETPSRYLLEVSADKLEAAAKLLAEAGVPFAQIGRFADHQRLTVRCPRHGRLLDESLDTLRETWRKPLDW